MSIQRANTLRRSLITGAALAAALGAARAPAATMEEVVAHGSVAVAVAQRARFEAEMAAYVRDVKHELEQAVRRSLKESSGPALRLAQATESHRG